MRMVLENNRRVSLLKSDLQGIMEVSTKALASHRSSTDGLESMEVKCERPSSSLWIVWHMGAAEPALI